MTKAHSRPRKRQEPHQQGQRVNLDLRQLPPSLHALARMAQRVHITPQPEHDGEP